MTTPGRILHLSGTLKHQGAGCTATYGLTKGRRPDDDESAAMLRAAEASLAIARVERAKNGLPS